MTVKYCVSCAGCVRIFEKPLLYIIYAVRDLLDKRQSLSDQIEQLEQEKTAIEQQVKLEMQDAAYGTAPGYKVSWVSSESKRVDSQRLKKEQPDIFNQYSKNVSSRRFTIIHAA